jgi:hypothetical protein
MRRLSLAVVFWCAACASQPGKESRPSPVTRVDVQEPGPASAPPAASTASPAPALASGGSGSSVAPPFDALPDAQVTAYRLQSYRPPAQAQTPAASAPAQPGASPGVPPEIQRWSRQGGAGLQQLLPPGLLPPNTQPGGAAAPAAAPPQPNVPRFPNRPDGFRILSQTEVIDEELKKSLSELLGDQDNFHDQHANCMYAELGLSFTSGQPEPNDVLISFSCNRVAAAGGFAWPHPSEGMTPELVSSLAAVTRKIFPPGT